MELELAPQVKQALSNRWEPMYRSQLHYLVTWNTRGRRPALKDRHVEALRELVHTTCEERDFELVELAVGADHVHVLFGLRPAQSVASAVRELKGRTSMSLMNQFPELRVWLRGNLVWDERYSVETVSTLRVEGLRERMSLAHRHPAEPDFHQEWAEAS